MALKRSKPTFLFGNSQEVANYTHRFLKLASRNFSTVRRSNFINPPEIKEVLIATSNKRGL